MAIVASRLQSVGVRGMHHWRASLSVVMLLLVVAGTAGASAGPVRENGRIVFVRARCSDMACTWQIVTATARDRQEHVLARFPDGAFDAHFIVNPSPDGRRLAFMANQKIWVMNADGSGRRAVFTPHDGTGVDDGPSFTRDGQHVVFTRCCPKGFGYSLWMISLQGTHLTDITKESVVNGDGPADVTPQVSPDGRLVAFDRCFPDQGCVVAVANLKTGRFHELTDPTLDSQQPNWAPDGRLIVFEYHTQNGTPNIATISPAGDHLRFLTNQTSGVSFDASYSPDGRWIIFSHFPGTGQTFDLYRMRPDATHRRTITRTPRAHEVEPKWMAAADDEDDRRANTG